MELWKRKQSVLVWEWDLQGTENDEEPRPEFETSVKTFRINPVTREKEPYMPFWYGFSYLCSFLPYYNFCTFRSKASRYALSAGGVLFMVGCFESFNLQKTLTFYFTDQCGPGCCFRYNHLSNFTCFCHLWRCWMVHSDTRKVIYDNDCCLN